MKKMSRLAIVMSLVGFGTATMAEPSKAWKGEVKRTGGGQEDGLAKVWVSGDRYRAEFEQNGKPMVTICDGEKTFRFTPGKKKARLVTQDTDMLAMWGSMAPGGEGETKAGKDEAIANVSCKVIEFNMSAQGQDAKAKEWIAKDSDIVMKREMQMGREKMTIMLEKFEVLDKLDDALVTLPEGMTIGEGDKGKKGGKGKNYQDKMNKMGDKMRNKLQKDKDKQQEEPAD